MDKIKALKICLEAYYFQESKRYDREVVKQINSLIEESEKEVK